MERGGGIAYADELLGGPALRQGHILLRAGSFALYGVDGLRYRTGRPAPVPIDHHVVSFADPAIRWTLASKLVRELGDYTVVDLYGQS
ncbi:hypothetical protein [Actinokineospora iranica]|uniref:hypothetical protein n=1 Tax=Actinokineospora iranica TaxID=1271860 RepID=UPI001E40C986|nr:hypothetical protein [Actinokineospora iranica]